MWEQAFSNIAAGAGELGLDLAAPLAIGWYNERVAAEYRAPDFADTASLAVLLGNSRALWPPFVAALARDDALYASPNPLETYLETGLARVLNDLPWRAEVRHEHEPPPRRVAIQTAAEVAGLAPRAPSQLSVHPLFGPWIALRALVIVDRPGPTQRPEPPQLSCDDCEHRCLAALEAALTNESAAAYGATQTGWQAWLAVRDACPAGRAHRYSGAQIRYHYAKDLEELRRLARPTR